MPIIVDAFFYGGRYVATHVQDDILALTLVVHGGFSVAPKPADAQVTAFKQAVAEAAARDKDIAAFYQANGYKSVWTGRSGRERARRKALIKALVERLVTRSADCAL